MMLKAFIFTLFIASVFCDKFDILNALKNELPNFSNEEEKLFQLVPDKFDINVDATETTPSPKTTHVSTTTVTTHGPKPTGSVKECKAEYKQCIGATSFWLRFRCVFKYKRCLWNLCPVKPCFDDLAVCVRKSKSMRQRYACYKTWRTCVKSHKKPTTKMF